MQAYCGRWKKNSLGMIFDIEMGLFFPKYKFKIVYNDADIKLSPYIHEGYWHWPPARLCEMKLGGEDFLSCLPSRIGKLSWKIAWEEIRTKCPTVEWIQFILVCPTVPSISRHSFIIWLANEDLAFKRDRLIPRDYEDYTLCMFCINCIEIWDHIFF